MRERGAVEKPVESRRLARTELSRVGEIDRTERIDLIYEQHGTELVERRGNWSAPPWDPDGHGEHSVDAQRHALEHYVDAGVGSRLCDDLELIARGAGDCEMVVSATPSDNTVRFYRRRGYELMAVPLPELFELEPEDVHMKKTL